ncbi:MAG: family 43 glycosylhydrolase [Bacilli bacterium]
MKSKAFFTTILGLTLMLSACGIKRDSYDEIVDLATLTTDAPRARYSNNFSQDNIPHYWEGYGTGDPFVFRFDGMYYLYCSSPNYAYSVMGWKSKDLIHWEQCDNGVNEKGKVGEHDCLYTAFAPEVCYFNGYFYMCESRRGMGHYFLKSSSPEGPFIPITENRAQEIDGSLYVDSDENIYFLRASHNGIRMLKVDENDPDFIISSQATQIEQAQIGAWTEGPNMFKKDGIYYLTYTGTNVTSAAYRVGYAYYEEQEVGGFFSSNAFKHGGLILLNTSDEFNGLGHSCNVMGPNMDSMYIVYHNLVSVNGPYRHYNLNRLMFNGTEMMVENPSLHDNFVPQLPEFATYDDTNFIIEDALKLSDQATEQRFTCEFNVKGDGKLYFSYQDANNYGFIKMAISEGKNILSINKVTDGETKILASVTMNKTYNLAALHSYRLAHDNGRITLAFDNMEKLSFTTDTPFTGGKIGYESTAKNSYTAFSNEAFDSSQRREFKQKSALAASYSEEISNLKPSSHTIYRQEFEGNGFDGTRAIKLENHADRASFRTYFAEGGCYGLDITVPVSYLGKKIGIRIDNGAVQNCRISKYEIYDNIAKVHLTSFEVSKGEHYISLYYKGDTVEFTKIDWYLTSNKKTTFENNLANYIPQGAYYVNSWKIKNDGHYALSGNRQLLYLGDDTLRDYSIEADLTFDGETDASTAGFVLRASNPAFQTSDDVNSIVGFYCGFNLTKAFITECHYNETIIGESAFVVCEPHTKYHLKATCIGNVITLYLDGKKIVNYITANGPTHGRGAFYTNGAATIYQNLKIETF